MVSYLFDNTQVYVLLLNNQIRRVGIDRMVRLCSFSCVGLFLYTGCFIGSRLWCCGTSSVCAELSDNFTACTLKMCSVEVGFLSFIIFIFCNFVVCTRLFTSFFYSLNTTKQKYIKTTNHNLQQSR